MPTDAPTAGAALLDSSSLLDRAAEQNFPNGRVNGGRVIQQGSLRARPPRAISFLAGTGGLSRGSLRIWVDVFGGAPCMSFRMSRGDPIHHFHVGHHPMRVDPDDAPERRMGTWWL